ncbi:MAG TPA: hypothetical protein VF294_14895, partial [Polyangiaceae bacterium]
GAASLAREHPVAAPAAISTPNPKTKNCGALLGLEPVCPNRASLRVIERVMLQERAARLGAYSRRIGVAKKRVLRPVRDVTDGLANAAAVGGAAPAVLL